MANDRAPRSPGPIAAAAPEPPWWRSRHDQRRRGGLSRERIVEAALTVLDRDGLDGLTMRRLATQLDVGVASLYWHVDGKEALLQLVIDRVMSEVPLPDPDPDHWQEQIKQFARDARTVTARYRDVGRATLGRIPVGPHLVRINEWALGLLTAAGIPPQAAAWAGDVFGLYLGAHAYESALDDDRSATATGGTGGTDENKGAAAPDGTQPLAIMLIRYMQSLPPEQFPNTLANLEHLGSGTQEERFEFGLDLLVRGLASYAEDHRGARP